MKLVIEIDEEYYKYIKDIPKCYRLESHKIIANGTPLEKHDAELLDKIRAEIADLDDADYDYEGYYKAVTDAVKIIDKYRKGQTNADSDEDRQRII